MKHHGVDDGIVAHRLRNGAVIHKAVQKRQGETLEIPVNTGGMFDDDVSAISSHTLEEMERLRQHQQRSKMYMLSPSTNKRGTNKQQPKSRLGGGMRPSDKKASRSAFTTSNNRHQLWTTGNIEEEASIGVSTSGSSSSPEEDDNEPAKITTRKGRKEQTK